MFAKTIIDSDAFLDMSQSAQNLYFHLSLRADDDGFINNPRSIMRTVGSRDDDMKLLIAKQFIIPFDSGVVVIKHWKIHNYIRNDRYKETKCLDEKALVGLDENNSYTTLDTTCLPCGIPTVSNLDTQDRLGKDRLGKDRLIERGTDKLSPLRFNPPSFEEVSAYCTERGNNIDPQYFVDFYSSKGWTVGKGKMKDWKACVRTWERRENNNASNKPKESGNVFKRMLEEQP